MTYTAVLDVEFNVVRSASAASDVDAFEFPAMFRDAEAHGGVQVGGGHEFGLRAGAKVSCWLLICVAFYLLALHIDWSIESIRTTTAPLEHFIKFHKVLKIVQSRIGYYFPIISKII